MNIYDIAELSGVSIATVSRVVNDSPKVSEKTKMKVRAVMEANNYTPNVFARGLGLNSMKTVGIVCPDVSDDYMAGSVAYLEKRLRSYGYDCILYCSGYEYEDKAAAVHLILQKRIDALLLEMLESGLKIPIWQTMPGLKRSASAWNIPSRCRNPCGNV